MIGERLEIMTFVVWFIVYIVVHIAIGFTVKEKKEQLKQDENNKDLKDGLTAFNFLFRWFPAIYLVIFVSYYFII